jgi:hypothetical protein
LKSYPGRMEFNSQDCSTSPRCCSSWIDHLPPSKFSQGMIVEGQPPTSKAAAVGLSAFESASLLPGVSPERNTEPPIRGQRYRGSAAMLGMAAEFGIGSDGHRCSPTSGAHWCTSISGGQILEEAPHEVRHSSRCCPSQACQITGPGLQVEEGCATCGSDVSGLRRPCTRAHRPIGTSVFPAWQPSLKAAGPHSRGDPATGHVSDVSLLDIVLHG